MKSAKFIPLILFLVSCLLLLFFLWWHWDLGLHRYFDVDEYAHLHWASHMVAGQRPYVDFLYFFPPGFLWFLAPLFLLGGGTTPLLAGRILSFVIFVGLAGVATLSFWEVRRSWVAIVVAVILAFLPLPFDRYLDIRPDNLATLLVFLGMYFQIRFLGNKAKTDGLRAGLFYGASLIVLTKTVPQIAFAVLIGFLSHLTYKQGKGLNDLKKALIVSAHNLVPLLVGLAIPLIVCLVWALLLGDPDVVVYSLTKLPFEANKISQFFIMLPNLFFYPNEVLYGTGGYNQGLIANHIVWVVGLAYGIYRFFTLYLTRGRQFLWEELLLSGTFVVHVVLYVLFIPLKHTQYLIPIGIFISIFAADALNSVWQKVRKQPVGSVLFAGAWVIGAIFLYRTFLTVVVPKRTWTNDASLAMARTIYAMIPGDAYVLDLDGLMLYTPDPYDACCIPFGQFARFLSRPLPSLSATLEETQVKYIYQGELRRVSTLEPQDQAYIAAHFVPWEGGDQLLIRTK